MNIFEIRDICKHQKNLIEYFGEKGIVHKSVYCIPCNKNFSLIKENAKLCGYVWRCSTCRKKQSVLKDSYFEGAHLSLERILYLCFYWSTKTQYFTTLQHLSLSSNTAVDWYQYFRDICS